MCVLVLLGAIVVLVAYARLTNQGALDVLNWVVSRQVRFRPFYAGTEHTPRVVDFVPEVRAMEADFDRLRTEIVSLLAKIDGVPTMQDTYNHMFLNAVSSSKRGRPKWYHPISTQLWRLVYGKHIDTFNKIATDKWRTLNLILYEHVIVENAVLCPKLVAHLVEIPNLQSALVSFMYPGAYVGPHCDPQCTGVYRYHLAFVVPKNRERCYITVDGQRYHWAEGQSVLFDTVFEHEVRNDTDECRVVLFVDLLRPLVGFPNWIQGIANTLNRFSPGTHAVIKNSSCLKLKSQSNIVS